MGWDKMSLREKGPIVTQEKDKKVGYKYEMRDQ